MTVKAHGTKIEFGYILSKNVEDKEQLKCQWFESHGSLHEDVFPAASLELN